MLRVCHTLYHLNRFCQQWISFSKAILRCLYSWQRVLPKNKQKKKEKKNPKCWVEFFFL